MKARELWDGILKEHQDFIGGLYARWLDEKEYEDIQDYLAAIRKRLPTAFQIKKRPFTVLFHADDCDLEMRVAVRGNYVSLTAKPVAHK